MELFFFPASSISIPVAGNFFLTSVAFTRKTTLVSLLRKRSLLRGESGSRSDCAKRSKAETQYTELVYGNVSKRGERTSGRPVFIFYGRSVARTPEASPYRRGASSMHRQSRISPRQRHWPPRPAPAPDKCTRNRRSCTGSRVSPGTRRRGHPRRLPEFPSGLC
jgi:hypothetical protein